jgi:deoxyadenosine/deoxycytidine kinase
MIISIDGNIGAGKTTVMKYLRSTYKYDIDLEPVDEWIPFLHDMYKNNKDAFEFQIKVWLDRQYMPTYPHHKKVLVERSGYFQWHVFTKSSIETGRINERQYNLLKTMYDNCLFYPDIYIYLQTTPSETFKRIHKRARNCESDIDENYVEKIHAMHENAYDNLSQEPGVICHIINVEGKSIKQIGDDIHAILNKN